jgi:hypothetical protein
MRPIIAVIGSSTGTPEEAALAEEVGRRLGAAGAIADRFGPGIDIPRVATAAEAVTQALAQAKGR